MRVLLYSGLLLFSCLLWSCEGSFGTNNTGGSPQTVTNSYWYGLPNQYAAVTIYGNCNQLGANQPPAGSRIVIAWETNNTRPVPGFIFYGNDTIFSTQSGKWAYKAIFPDTLPSLAVTIDTAAKSGIAVGHIFLVGPQSTIHDTLVIDQANLSSYPLLGTGVISDDGGGGPGSTKLLSVIYFYGLAATPGVTINGSDQWIDSSYALTAGSYNFLTIDKFQGPEVGSKFSHFDIADKPNGTTQSYDHWLH